MDKRGTRKLDLSFIDVYGYPYQVKQHFEEILSCIDGTHVQSVLLTGSTSRGELSYVIKDSRLSVYGDYEFFVIARGAIDKVDRDRLAKAYAALERKFASSPLFHIDYTYIDKTRLRNLPLHLKHFETKRNGITIYGDDLKGLLPYVTIAGLDFKDLNEILIWRLWSMLLYLPQWLLEGRTATRDEELLYRYVVCRNFLDLATWILPRKGVLLASFRERADYLMAHFNEVQDNIVLDADFLDLLNQCMRGKLKLEFSLNARELYYTVVKYFLKARDHLMLHAVDERTRADVYQSTKTASHLIFPDHNYRRKVYEIMFILRNARSLGFTGRIRWLFSGKYGLMLEFLCAIHQALLTRLYGIPEADFHLNRAAAALEQLSPWNNPEITDQDFSATWLSLRRGFAGFLKDYFRSIRMKSDYIDSVLG